uniref:Ankyrin repeat and kinase domain containing 1 n=1 Tax=Loxodonta africana TaxID=9785 RepID=G3U9U1_LOXAF
MATSVERRLGSLTIFSRDDFEGDWRQVARGGFGQVFQARHKRWRLEYAIKCSPCLLAEATSSDVNCLIEEAAKMEKIKFEDIVSIYRVYKQPLGIVMEFMANGSLEKMLPIHSLCWQLEFHIIHETSLAMSFLHSIKPSLLHLPVATCELSLTDRQWLHVSDFGPSKCMEQSTQMQHIERSALRGTLSYNPLKRFCEKGHSGSTVPTHSFGIVVWEILTQQKPSSGFSMMTIIVRVAAGIRPSLQLISDEWPGEAQQMVDLMKRCLDQDPKKRPCFPELTLKIKGVNEEVSQEVTDSGESRAPHGNRECTVEGKMESTQTLFPSCPSPGPHPQACHKSGVVDPFPQHPSPCSRMAHLPGARGSAFRSIPCSHKLPSWPGSWRSSDYRVPATNLFSTGSHLLCARHSPESFYLHSSSTQRQYLIFLPGDSRDYLERVLQLLDMTHGNPNKATPLHFLVAQGNVEQVRLLLVHQVDVDCQTASGYTPLVIPAQDQQPDLCALLLEHDADANLVDEDESGDDWTTCLLLDRRACTDAQEHEGWTPLHLAAQNNFENVAQLLVSRQADPNVHKAEGKTPLHVAAYFGHVSLVKLLTGQKAQLDAQQRNLRTPLHLAVERGKVRAIQHLLKSKAAPDALDQGGYGPLHTAATRGKYLICKILLRYGASTELPTQQGWTPLHLVAYKGLLEITHLLAESHADLGAHGGMNWTPLHLAACHGEEVVVSTLLRCGADPNVAKQTGWTPLHLAVQRGAFLRIINLLEHHADVHAYS